MSKSERTRRRHKRAWKGQTTLDSYIFKNDQPILDPSQSAAPSVMFLIHALLMSFVDSSIVPTGL